MLKVGDTVKVIDKADIADVEGRRELYPIGTICIVMEVENHCDDADYRVVELDKVKFANEYDGWWYKENELEKGKLVWVKED